MDKEKDILENGRAKENPWKVPQGYFDTLAVRVQARKQARETTLMHKVTPYLAIAASFALITIAGTSVLRLTSGSRDAEVTTSGSYYSQNSSSEVSEDDIINYLIYAGISAEEINALSQE